MTRPIYSPTCVITCKDICGSRVEPVTSELSIEEFKLRFSQLFKEYSHHLVVAWFLANTKGELQKLSLGRLHILFVTTDFAENVVARRKYELADQHFHQIEILLFGAVVSFVVYDDSGEPILRQMSYMVSSDYRLVHFYRDSSLDIYESF